MEPIYVRSYIRGGKKQAPSKEINETPQWPVIFLIGSAALMLAVFYWYITAPLCVALGAAYGVKTIATQHLSPTVAEERTEPENAPKGKRHYQHRLRVYNYQTGKTIKV